MVLKYLSIASLSLILSHSAYASDCDIKIYAKFKKEFSDPIKAINWWDKKYVSLVYDTLIRFDENGSLHPGLASKWKVDRKQNILKVWLKKDRRFHDGSLVTAQDVARNLDRLKKEKNPDAAKMSNVVEVTPTSSNEIEIKYNKLTSYDIYLLATPRFSIYKPTNSKIGTGPWILREKKENVMNFDLFKSSDVKSQCSVLRTVDVEFKKALELFQKGELDIIEYISLSKEELNQVKNISEGKGEVHAFKSFDTTILFQTLSGSVDYELSRKLVENLFNNLNLVANSQDIIAANIIPPGINSVFDGPVTKKPIQKWVELPPLDIFIPDTTEYKGALVPNLRSIFSQNKGKINLRIVPLEDLYRLHEKGKVQFHIETVTLQVPHPYGILSMFQSGSRENFTRYFNAKFDGLLLQGLELDGQVANEKFNEAAQIVIKEGIAIPLVHQIKHVIISNKISGYNFSKISTYHEYYSSLSKSGSK